MNGFARKTFCIRLEAVVVVHRQTSSATHADGGMHNHITTRARKTSTRISPTTEAPLLQLTQQTHRRRRCCRQTARQH